MLVFCNSLPSLMGADATQRTLASGERPRSKRKGFVALARLMSSVDCRRRACRKDRAGLAGEVCEGGVDLGPEERGPWAWLLPRDASLDGATLSSTVGERLLAISTSPKGGISVELVTGLGNMGTFDPAKPSRGSASGQKGLVYMRRGKRTTFA